ncbi:HGL271Cp [Eremothecium sinecaudum]|uniref:DNA-(apurinic or apyrimidinic site) lyase n=1 Tax=Eremothecium sinecaudum TaxID=45286 RepID=A0A0X8HV50_9SACH|nr:HGL271Cp [Eremothecium sinecaudum]AMD22069.1 HGL271Cp [Eremothecium sinecaudum]
MRFDRLLFPKGEVILAHVLQCGQAFRWVWNSNKNYYATSMLLNDSLGYKIVILRQKDESTIEYSIYKDDSDKSFDALRTCLQHYLRLDVSLEKLLSEWSAVDKNFVNKCHRGVRVLGQEPWETLCSFICSSNNNISRITKMCHSLCGEYGKEIGNLDGISYYSFPSSNDIVHKASEEHLRELGFGYRARYIIGAAKLMHQDKPVSMSDTEYIKSWHKKLSKPEIRERFLAFPGVGPKVADCVCLMGMQMDDVVPIDVHMQRIAERDYRFNATANKAEELKERYKALPLTRKSMNIKLELAREMFASKWGPYAGWAQGVIFAQEINKTVGATTEDMHLVKRVKKEEEKSSSATLEVKVEGIEYSNTGRPMRWASKKVNYNV